MSNHISQESLFNHGAVTGSGSRKPGFVPIDSVGATTNRSAVAITDSATKITIGTNKRTIEVQNVGTKTIYFGGSGVDSTDGIKIFPNGQKVWANVQDDFEVYFVCHTGESSNLAVVEYA